MSEPLRIATRKSPLALWQAEHVAAALKAAHPGLAVEIVGMTTKGDRILDAPLAKVGGKGLFVKELEQGMLAGEADIAVHSMKDVPVDFPRGCTWPVILEREDPRTPSSPTASSGWTSCRRGPGWAPPACAASASSPPAGPDLHIEPLRGNVNSRLAKLDAGDYDAILLACGGADPARASPSASAPASAPRTACPPSARGPSGSSAGATTRAPRPSSPPCTTGDGPAGAGRAGPERPAPRGLPGAHRRPRDPGGRTAAPARTGGHPGREPGPARRRPRGPRPTRRPWVAVAEDLLARGPGRSWAPCTGPESPGSDGFTLQSWGPRRPGDPPGGSGGPLCDLIRPPAGGPSPSRPWRLPRSRIPALPGASSPRAGT
jgi:hypothetical protein